MNTKYEELSVVGKIWSLAEIFSAGLIDGKEAYIKATFRRLDELKNQKEVLASNVFLQQEIENLIVSANIQKQFMSGEEITEDYIDDESVSSMLWFDSIVLFGIKRRVKDNEILYDDMACLTKVFNDIKSLWICDLKEKFLTIDERRDLFEIKEHVEDLKVKLEKRIDRNQINII